MWRLYVLVDRGYADQNIMHSALNDPGLYWSDDQRSEVSLVLLRDFLALGWQKSK
jgi:hypothetical protein